MAWIRWIEEERAGGHPAEVYAERAGRDGKAPGAAEATHGNPAAPPGPGRRACPRESSLGGSSGDDPLADALRRVPSTAPGNPRRHAPAG